MITECFTKRERVRKTARLLAHENDSFNDEVQKCEIIPSIVFAYQIIDERNKTLATKTIQM